MNDTVVTPYTAPAASEPSSEEKTPTPETPIPATVVADPAPEATETPSPVLTDSEKVWKIISSWFHGHMNGSAVAQHTPAFNHVKASLPALHAALVKET